MCFSAVSCIKLIKEPVQMSEKEYSKIELVNVILGDENAKAEEEEIMHLLLQQKLSSNTDKLSDEQLTFGSRMADKIAKVAGSWTFIIAFVSCLTIWIMLNTVLVIFGKNSAYDPYPFILLNLVLSCVAALQAPVIMMSQNRQESKDRLRAQNDYKINLKSEIIIEDLHEKVDKLIENQEIIMNLLSKKSDKS
jgi:uncharacterized membrane protein